MGDIMKISPSFLESKGKYCVSWITGMNKPWSVIQTLGKINQSIKLT